MNKKPPTTDTLSPTSDMPSRRDFLKTGSSAAVLGGLSVMSVPAVQAGARKPIGHQSYQSRERAQAAARLKTICARQHLQETRALRKQRVNRDEQRYESERYYANFTKTLPCNAYGEVDPRAYRKLVKALRTGNPRHFDAIPLDPVSDRRLANPQGAFKYELMGLDSHATRMRHSWTFRSAELAGEACEVYWQALTRDVPFSEYASNPDIADAVADLNAMSSPPGATAGGNITPATLFRGETPGDRVGPYISQFLWQDFAFGSLDVVQKYQTPEAGIDFMRDVSNWLHIQRGGAPLETLAFAPEKRYINDNRALGEYVHRDVSFQAYLNAAMILLSYGSDAIDIGNPYVDHIDNQGGFTSLGAPFVLDMVTKAANLSLTGAWFQKWRVHRLLRPEAYAGRVHFTLTGERDYELHPDILNAAAIDRVANQSGTYLLPLAFTEGSPTHPSYPAGHATIAGACVTVLKAFFNEGFVIPTPVESNASGDALLPYTGGDLTVGGELNKLANNIAIGRDAAGVHYRQDGIQGLEVGEQQAVALLQDQSRTCNERGFDGFELTRFNGERILIKDGEVSTS
ncbi:MAG: vanadium-dependent haloperoxidase [Pseudomonadota bacterium]